MKLKELFTFLPKSDKPASYGKESGIYPFFTSSNVINKYVDEADYSGEFLIIGDGGTGNCKYYNGAFSASDHNYVLKPINHKNTRLIRYFLMKDDYKVLNDGFKGVGIKNISKSYIGEIEYYKNSKYSDEFVVDSLDHINGEIDKLNNELFLFDELIKSRFIEMFGSIENNIKKYSISKIEDLCILIKDGTHQTPTYVDKSNNSFKFLSSKDVMSKTIDWSNIKYIPESLHKKLYAAVKPQKNDILMSKNGVNYGVAAVNDTNEIFDIYVSLALLRPNLSIITPEYFSYALNDDDTKQQFKASIKGVGVPNLHLGEIKKAKILVPPIKEQLEFIYYTKQIDKLKFNVQKQIKYYQELLDLKMHEYFDVEEED